MRGASSTQGETSSTATSESDTESESRSFMRARTETRSHAHGTMRGTTRNSGESEAFESVYEDLPSSFHSKENVLWMQGELLRSLPPGTAAVSFVDGARRESTILKVPFVSLPSLPEADFWTLRARFLDMAPSTKPAHTASRMIEDRERAIIAEAVSAIAPPPEPNSFREPVRRPKKPDERARNDKTKPPRTLI